MYSMTPCMVHMYLYMYVCARYASNILNYMDVNIIFVVVVTFHFSHTLINCSVIFGVGEMDIQREASLSPSSPPHAPPPSPPLPYLLLDVRHKDDYDQCHIRTGEPDNQSVSEYFCESLLSFLNAQCIAMSYPATMLSRSCNYFTKEILEYVSFLITLTCSVYHYQ